MRAGNFPVIFTPKTVHSLALQRIPPPIGDAVLANRALQNKMVTASTFNWQTLRWKISLPAILIIMQTCWHMCYKADLN
jgi:hypothetical protein